MFNFKALKLDKRNDSSNQDPFVGIRRNQKTYELEFRLPRGFQDFPDSNFELTKRFFFRMYRTFKKFEHDHKIAEKSINEQDDNKSIKDNIEKRRGAYQFTDKEGNDVLLYSKISIIDNILDAYDDLSLDMIERRIGRNENIDYSKLDYYLDKATYLANDVIYIDEMDLPRQTFQRDATSLIDLFCFIVSELKSELEQNECIDTHVDELSKRFKAQHLNHEQSLFNEETFEITLVILKDILNKINQTTVYKDEEYWQLYEAIEMFLYGELDMQNTHEDGIFWGINQFYQVWEDMCNTYLLFDLNTANPTVNVIYADTEITINGKNIANNKETDTKIFKKKCFENPFFIKFRQETKWIRPDIIYQTNATIIDNNNIQIQLEDKLDIIKNTKNFNAVFDIQLNDINGNFQYTQEKNLQVISKLIFNAFKEEQKFKNSGFPGKKKNQQYLNSIKTKLKKESKKVFFIADWKYLDESSFLEKNTKEIEFVTKQCVYEHILRQAKKNDLVLSQFFIPYFYKTDDIGQYVEDNLLSQRIKDAEMIVFKLNFQVIQNTYLKS